MDKKVQALVPQWQEQKTVDVLQLNSVQVDGLNKKKERETNVITSFESVQNYTLSLDILNNLSKNNNIIAETGSEDSQFMLAVPKDKLSDKEALDRELSGNDKTAEIFQLDPFEDKSDSVLVLGYGSVDWKLCHALKEAANDEKWVESTNKLHLLEHKNAINVLKFL